ncbi:MAG: ABC transporter ATP-binding protein, partial [Simkania sp.]|nr:ABC transporter ATP-binding protein [Simkania sp.]
EVEEGQLFGYLGANGSGKTTTIKILMSLLHATQGNAKIFGKSVQDPQSRVEVGFLPENPYFYEYLTPLESLRFYGKLQNVSSEEIQSRGEKLLEMTQLTHAKNTRLGDFSKGMRQRLGLSQALINDPKLLVLDEPLSGLDPMGRKLVKDLILEQRRKGKTVFFSSHILSDVEEMCDHIAILVKGELKQRGTVEDLVSPAYRKYNLHLIEINEAIQKLVTDRTSEYRLIGNEIRCEIPATEDLDDFLQKIQAQGGKIRALVPEKETLEEYFVRISSSASEDSKS